MDKIIAHLKRGEIGIIPTDTTYGLVGQALNPETVERIYHVRERNRDKPFIILLDSLASIKKFHLVLSRAQRAKLKDWWPGPVSVILPCAQSKFAYLHNDTYALAFRVPAKESLRKLLKATGPLVAPSANLAGKPTAVSIQEAQKYFGNKIDFYVDGGAVSGKPSTLVSLEAGNTFKIIRLGEKKL